MHLLQIFLSQNDIWSQVAVVGQQLMSIATEDIIREVGHQRSSMHVDGQESCQAQFLNLIMFPAGIAYGDNLIPNSGPDNGLTQDPYREGSRSEVLAM